MSEGFYLLDIFPLEVRGNSAYYESLGTIIIACLWKRAKVWQDNWIFQCTQNFDSVIFNQKLSYIPGSFDQLKFHILKTLIFGKLWHFIPLAIIHTNMKTLMNGLLGNYYHKCFPKWLKFSNAYTKLEVGDTL
jgi:hypothetical protein